MALFLLFTVNAYLLYRAIFINATILMELIVVVEMKN